MNLVVLLTLFGSMITMRAVNSFKSIFQSVKIPVVLLNRINKNTIRIAPPRYFATSVNQVNTDEKLTFDQLRDIELPTNDNNPNLLRIRHSTAHIMAMAVQRLYPSSKVTIGPFIENGFYYDFFIPDKQLTNDDLKRIQKEMTKIIKENLTIEREEVTREDAK